MNIKNKITRTAKVAVCFMLVTAFMRVAAYAQQGVPGHIKTKDGTMSGKIRWLKASKMYVINVRGVDMRVAPSKVLDIRVKEPAVLRPALNKVRAKQYSSAAPILKKIASAYDRLEHDAPALAGLAQCQLGMKKYRDARIICEKAMRANPKLAQDDVFAPVYWDALLKEKQYPTLEIALKKAIEQGSHELAAIAQVKRGHIHKEQGNFKEANLDGYLRTILLFNRVKKVQPEAYYHSIKCFEALRQTSYADKMRQKMLAEYPRDPYTARIKNGT